METVALGPATTSITPEKNRFVTTADLTSRTLRHVGMGLAAAGVACQAPAWVNSTFDLFAQQALVIRPILKGYKSIGHWQALKAEWNSDEGSALQVALLTDLLAFDFFYVAAAALRGGQLLTGSATIGMLGQVAMGGVLTTLPGIYLGIMVHAFRSNKEASDTGKATVRQLHENTYDLLLLLLMGTCDAISTQLIPCNWKQIIIPLLGALATTTEIWYIWTLPDKEK